MSVSTHKKSLLAFTLGCPKSKKTFHSPPQAGEPVHQETETQDISLLDEIDRTALQQGAPGLENPGPVGPATIRQKE